MATEDKIGANAIVVYKALEAALRELAADRSGADIDLPMSIIQDSLDLMSLLVSLEDKLGVALNDDLVFDLDLTSRQELGRGITAMMGA